MVLSKNMNPSSYAAYLSGIEYAYAPISKTISEHLETLSLSSNQSHYSVHSDLDWIHGEELLSVSFNLSSEVETIKNAFITGQVEFLELYNHLIIPTALEIKEINKQPISFYYTREDSSIEIKAINSTFNKNTNNNILMIVSGGETLIDILGLPCSLNIDVIDMNENQINLCKLKNLEILSDYNYSNKENKFIGKFEQLFYKIRTLFDYNGNGFLSDYINESDLAKEKLKYIINELFSNQNLSYVFSEEATKYSSESFAEHFYNVFIQSCKTKQFSLVTKQNIENIIDGIDIVPSNNTKQALKNNHFKHLINYKLCNFKSLETDKKYNVVTVSNIGDWMSLEDYKNILLKIKSQLTPDGILIARKLLGDYNLKNLLIECGFKVKEDYDATGFYSEVYCGINQ